MAADIDAYEAVRPNSDPTSDDACQACGHIREGEWPWQHHDGCAWIGWVRAEQVRMQMLPPSTFVITDVTY